MVSEEQVKHELISVYSKYLLNQRDRENNQNANKIYLKYFNGANALFLDNVSSAIWKSFDLSEGKLQIEEAKKILENLQK